LFSPVFDLLGPGFGGLHTPALVDDYYLTQTGQSYSGYAQVAYKPIDVVEIDVGGRYSYEQKQITSLRDGGGLGDTISTPILNSSTFLTPTPDKVSFPDFSPEVTVSYRPSPNLTFYGSYKHGFLSGGFNSSSVNFQSEPNISYQPEIVKGGELGAKAALLNGSLRLNADAYYYTISGLQVTEFTNATSTIRNAGAARTQGMEGDFAYVPPILDGLNVHGAAAFNDGIYTSFPGAPCYNGETPTEGCHIVAGNPIQNLSNSQLPRAPMWNMSGGFTYETPVGGNLKLGLESDVNYSSSYLTDATSAPQSRQPDYVLFDSSIRLGALNDKWQVALIGNNLTNTHYFVADPDVPFTGSGTGTAAGKLGDRFATVSRGREVMLQATYKFF
jgi:iron complex outermembrane receptor protein